MGTRPKYDDLPNPREPACQLMAAQLEAHMAEFNPVQLKALEESSQLQQFLEERASQARLVYLEAREAGLSRLQAGELTDRELFPPPEVSEKDEEQEC